MWWPKRSRDCGSAHYSDCADAQPRTRGPVQPLDATATVALRILLGPLPAQLLLCAAVGVLAVGLRRLLLIEG